MHTNPKLDASQRQRAAEELFSPEVPARTWTPRAVPGGPEEPEPEDTTPLERKSYCILRGRIELLPTLELRNRRGQKRLFDWDGVTGANLDDPGQLVLHVQRGGEPYTITVSGRGLDVELVDGICDKRVEWIAELDELAAAAVVKADPTEPVVTGIYIAKGSVSSEWGPGAPPAR
jgi:hypothetical protein